MSGYDEAKARFDAAVEAGDRLEAEMALSDMKHENAQLAWRLARAGMRWWWEPSP